MRSCGITGITATRTYFPNSPRMPWWRMAHVARIVVPGLPHLVTQHGNRRERIFFEEGDYALDRDLLAAACRKADVAVWAYCLSMACGRRRSAVHLTDELRK
jgi:hypothetical protein